MPPIPPELLARRAQTHDVQTTPPPIGGQRRFGGGYFGPPGAGNPQSAISPSPGGQRRHGAMGRSSGPGAGGGGGGVPITYPEGTWAARSEEDRLERQREWAESDDLNPESVADQMYLVELEALNQPSSMSPWVSPEFDPSSMMDAYGNYISGSTSAHEGRVQNLEDAYGNYIGGATDAYGNYVDTANAAFDQYMGLLEGISTAPRTSRIEDMYGLATAEAERRRGGVEGYEETATARLEADSELFLERLGTSHDEFDAEVDLIRDAQKDRLEGFSTTRQENIDAAAAELGDAAATFLISSTRSTDILDAQADRQITHSDRFDRLYAGWALDREMDAHGIVGKERRDLADRVLAMKEQIFRFEYEAGQDYQERMFVAEESAAEREADMTRSMAELGFGHASNLAELGYGHAGQMAEAGYTHAGDMAELGYTHAGQMADVGLQRDLAVGAAEDEFNTMWDEAEAYWENPVTANAFFGMDPSMMAGADPQTMFENWLAIQQMQGDAAGDATGPLYQDPYEGLFWPDVYTVDEFGQVIPNASGMSTTAGVLGVAPSEFTSDFAANLTAP